jgi:type IV secretion system protein VirB10
MYFQSTQQTGDSMASTILKDSLQIPPTITKNQGERIAIFVARDLDFGAVYDLIPQAPAQQTIIAQP